MTERGGSGIRPSVSRSDGRRGLASRWGSRVARRALAVRRWTWRAVASLGILTLVAAVPRDAPQLPSRISAQEFWRLVTEISEPPGHFRSENLVSNEVTYQHVIPELMRGRLAGGVYLGVGPDQNFTYIVAMRPRVAFIVDIRRQALLQHLMYKALVEMAEDRVSFLSLLFSRPRPDGIDKDASLADLFQAVYAVSPDSSVMWRNFAAIKERLTQHHGFQLSPADLAGIEFIFTAFFTAGPDITYDWADGRGGFGRGMPTYSQLMLEDDGNGLNRSYLATDANYQVLRDLHLRNVIIPVVGDFAGPKALRAIGRYLKSHGATVSAVYTSNVEQYLFQGVDNWKRYYDNIATLPIDSTSTFVRAVFTRGGVRYPATYGPLSMTMLCSVADLLREFHEGRLYSYQQVIDMSR